MPIWDGEGHTRRKWNNNDTLLWCVFLNLYEKLIRILLEFLFFFLDKGASIYVNLLTSFMY